jgi:hypothetical protein
LVETVAHDIIGAMPIASPRRRQPQPDEQLTLPLAWLDDAAFMAALRERGVVVGGVRFKANRTRLISISADRRSLNLHDCFRAAPGPVIDAVASFVKARHRSAEYRRAIVRMREWWSAQATSQPAASRAGSGACCGTAEQRHYLGRMYRQLNQERFGGRLPELLPVRLSNRMSRRLGHVTYGRTPAGARTCEEIALNVDLMLAGNEQVLLDTLVHEMAHAEAWLQHGHRGHGRIWRTVAARVGCEPRACTDVRIRRRTARRAAVTRVPE